MPLGEAVPEEIHERGGVIGSKKRAEGQVEFQAAGVGDV
ncbi:hypothetical protein CENDO_00430 [Corynebacterium endometrii]|uniref:Uncharacterized protein n=1 Tax=Corynebacterium endometrii TaxID=2488819 RepID=A0A4P7QEW1_9CORY|nr:hypothetical protein CENDO_00430 [Corynebacterium endometrii]